MKTLQPFIVLRLNDGSLQPGLADSKSPVVKVQQTDSGIPLLPCWIEETLPLLTRQNHKKNSAPGMRWIKPAHSTQKHSGHPAENANPRLLLLPLLETTQQIANRLSHRANSNGRGPRET